MEFVKWMSLLTFAVAINWTNVAIAEDLPRLPFDFLRACVR